MSPQCGEIEDKMEKGEVSGRRGNRKENVHDMLGRLHLHVREIEDFVSEDEEEELLT
jgi:hypothetical protein